MLEALKCPACSASLEYPADGSDLRCPYCNTVVHSDSLPRRAGRASSDHVSRAAISGSKLVVGFFSTVVILFLIVITPILAMVRARARYVQTTNVPKLVIAPPIPRPPTSIPVFIKPASKPAPLPEFANKVMEFGVEGVGPGRFQQAECVALDNNGHVFVGEAGGGRIQVFDLTGKYLAGWKIEGARQMYALAADRKGNLYVNIAPDLLKFEAMTGKPLGKMDDMNTDVEEFYRDVYVTVDGDVYAIGGNAHIIQFDAEGKIKRTINASEKVGEAVGLTRVLVQPTGEIFCLDPDRGIFKFANDGRYINRFGKEYVTGLGAPQFLATDSKGRLYLTGQGPSVRVFTPDGALIDTFGKETAYGIAISDSNDIYASFVSRHVIRKFVLQTP